MRVQYRWYSRNQRFLTRLMTPCNEHLQVKLFGLHTATSDVSVSKVNEYVMERQVRQRSRMRHVQAIAVDRGNRSLPKGVGENFFLIKLYALFLLWAKL